MKAEDILSQYDLDYQDGRSYSVDSTLSAMKEYAKQQIKKDRERVIAEIPQQFESDVRNLPIELD